MYFDIHKHFSDYTKIDKKTLICIFPDEFNYINKKTDYSFSVGVHPKDISKVTAGCLKLINGTLSKPNVFALGEIGLDKLFPDYKKQKTLFSNLINISEQHNKPVIIHSVKASSDILYYRKKYNKNPWIIHGFRGKWKLCRQFLNSNCSISLGSYIATSKKNFNELIKKIPLELLFFETDESNVKIKDIYKEFANVREISISELKKQVTENIKRTFGETLAVTIAKEKSP